MLGISREAESFTESVIREMNRVAVQHGGVSLAARNDRRLGR
jgi:hypothetical protein